MHAERRSQRPYADKVLATANTATMIRLVCLTVFLLRLFNLCLLRSFVYFPSHRSPSFFFFRIHYMDSPDRLLLFLTISVFCFLVFLLLHVLVVGSVR